VGRKKIQFGEFKYFDAAASRINMEVEHKWRSAFERKMRRGQPLNRETE